MNEERAYERAKERVEEKLGFISHLAAYVVINAFLFFIDYRTDRVINWAYWPLIGWGIGLLFHGLNTFLLGEGSAWKERMIKKEMSKERTEGVSGEVSGDMSGEVSDKASGDLAGKE
ncbi:MAG: 2TM domain-containing protein [bacterium]|jgi:hypothetical protein